MVELTLLATAWLLGFLFGLNVSRLFAKEEPQQVTTKVTITYGDE